MARHKNRPPCPNCQGRKQRSYTSGWANDETIPVMVVKCLDCGYLGHQGTIWLPDNTSLNALDEGRRMLNRMYHRLRNKSYAQLRPLTRQRGRRLTSDRLDIRARIIPGRVDDHLAARLATLRQKRHEVVTDTLNGNPCRICWDKYARKDGLCHACAQTEIPA